METVILFDTSIGSLNQGDEIIMESVVRELNPILKNRYIIKSTTHSPVITDKQSLCKNSKMIAYNDAKYKFIGGTNLLWRSLNYEWPEFNVNLLNCVPYKNSILIGAGSGKYRHEPDDYTKQLYNKVLSHDFIHSVRDNNTKEFLETLGFKAINTGCPTMWRFSEEFCAEIPTEKAKKVVFTLTFHKKDVTSDQRMLDILFDNYDEIYFWPQGINDFQYLGQLKCRGELKVVEPNLEAYRNLLQNNDIDYIGTRLHGGLFAMQHKKRTIIIVIDDRVRHMKQSYSLKTVERQDTYLLEHIINSKFRTNVDINYNNIKEYMSQFSIV